MKSLFVFILILMQIGRLPFTQQTKEYMFFIKSIIYLLVSSVHSIILGFTIPLGAIIMSLILLTDRQNSKVKLSLIFTGVIIVLFSTFSFSNITNILCSFYIRTETLQTYKIEVSAYTPEASHFLFEITDTEIIDEWVSSINSSMPNMLFDSKLIPSTLGYEVKLFRPDGSSSFILTKATLNTTNLFLGKYLLPFFNQGLVSLIESIHPINPEVLTINSSLESMINITNKNMLNKLFEIIIWSEKEIVNDIDYSIFSIPAYLFFKTNLGCRLYFTPNFEQAYIKGQGIITMPENTQQTLSEQFTLSRQSIVETFREFQPVHTSSPSINYENFFIEPDDNELFYGLYKQDYLSGEKFYLHNVSSLESEYFLLQSPYILLLDKKSAGNSDLMLINQNLPTRHRYVVKNQNIIPSSIAICPAQANFIFISQNNDSATLHYVHDYYRSPQSIISGNILDCIFLSERYIVFTEEKNHEIFLCVYDKMLNNIVKSSYIPGQVKFIESYNHQVLFAVQDIDNLDLKEGIFTLNSDLSISLADFNKTTLFH
ncbi:MAG: hypothetical protein ATN31_10905 [Candidatus Epulonipiscioides saccharophilum]|nr:MAG: hypothetical protein ATN31_10905 [Epulopiscium sp. AS2M-Bin001]